ncbi:MAG: Rne/Rng family ribonuclease [Gammaproteobacteria bacterium]|nr:Rne/Rng family ribonuclease [Gammaproteobacteria bacterium]
MERMLINASQRDEKRVAIVAENVLYDFITERPGFEQKIGNIYLAKITSIEPSLDAIFVDYGSDRHGFLPLKEISREYFISKPDHEGRQNIRDLLRIGQEIMIQVEKEERGNKGAALTTYISLAGSYLVLMPNSPRAGGISRRIEGDERDQLREILNQVSVPEGMGLIVRTAAIGRTNDELKWDLEVLLSHWSNIVAAAKTRSAPFLIHQEGNVVIRAIRDYVRQDTTEIIIDDETEFQNAKHYLEQIRPDVADRVKLYTDSTPLFSRYGIEHQIETAYKRSIDLPSGASIVIDYTEALVSIDVNSARATKGRNIESTAFNTNLEAAKEIARQLRLRDIGGLIVIDFIDMLDPSNQVEVEKHLSRALKNDRARIQIQRISRFGLLEMSRQRLRPSLRDSHQHVCPTCSGHGSIRSVDSVALTLVRIVEEEALKPQTSEIVIQASTEAATYLLNEKRHLLAAIEKNHEVKVSVIPNPNLQSSNFIKKRIRVSDVDEGGISSSDRLQVAQVDINLPSSTDRAAPDKPAVQQLIPTRPDKSPQTGSLVKRLWSSMFGSQDEDTQDTRVTSREPSPLKIETKPSYTSRAPAGKQRQRRPRSDDNQDNPPSQESSGDSRGRPNSRYNNERQSTDRSTQQRRGEPRQRSPGPRSRTTGRNPATKSSPSEKSTQYGEQFEPQSFTPKTPVVAPISPKPPVQEPRIEEAPIKIKASTTSTSATSKLQNVNEATQTTSANKTESPQPTFTFTSYSSETSSSTSEPVQGTSTTAGQSSVQTAKPASVSTTTSPGTPTATSVPPITNDGFMPGAIKLKEVSPNKSAPSENTTNAPKSSTQTSSSSSAPTSTISPSTAPKAVQTSSTSSAQASNISSSSSTSPTAVQTSSSSTSTGVNTTTPPAAAAQSSSRTSAPAATSSSPTQISGSSTGIGGSSDRPKISENAPMLGAASSTGTGTATTTSEPSSTQTPASQSEPLKSDEYQKPLVIRATTEEKSNAINKTEQTAESKDKDKEKAD